MWEVSIEKQKFHNLFLSVLQHKSASNSLLIFADSCQAKGTCCPISSTTHPQVTPSEVVTISLLSFLSKSL
jgi:hypothetical protein